MQIPISVAECNLRQILPVAESMLSLIEKNGGKSYLPPHIRDRINLFKANNWAEYYLDPNKIFMASLLCVYSRKEMEVIAYNFQQAKNDEERERLTFSIIRHVSEMDDDEILQIEPEDVTEEFQQELSEAINLMDKEGKEDIANYLHFTFVNMMITFYTSLSVMIYGRNIVDLVQRAINGDMDAFFMAYHIDQSVLELPFFSQRYRDALTNGELKFLVRLAETKEKRLLPSHITHHKLWHTFAFLESAGILYSIKREELFNLCQRLGVYGSSSDEKDVDGLNKRLQAYRKYQSLDYKAKKRGRKKSS